MTSLKEILPSRQNLAALAGLIGYVVFWLLVVGFMISIVITLVWGLFVYVLPALLAIGLALYLIYSLLILIVSIPFSLLIFLLGLVQGNRSISFHRTRNIFASTMAILIVADLFNITLLSTFFSRLYTSDTSSKIENLLPGLLAILAVATFLHMMRQIYIDGFEAIRDIDKSQWSFWYWVKWPPVVFLGILSDFLLPSLLILAYIGANAAAFDESTLVLGEYLNSGISSFFMHYFNIKIDLAQRISIALEGEDWLTITSTFFTQIYNTTVAFLEYWYKDFL